MNIQRPQANGWQFGRVIGVPVEARTWAKIEMRADVAAEIAQVLVRPGRPHLAIEPGLRRARRTSPCRSRRRWCAAVDSERAAGSARPANGRAQSRIVPAGWSLRDRRSSGTSQFSRFGLQRGKPMRQTDGKPVRSHKYGPFAGRCHPSGIAEAPRRTPARGLRVGMLMAISWGMLPTRPASAATLPSGEGLQWHLP